MIHKFNLSNTLYFLYELSYEKSYTHYSMSVTASKRIASVDILRGIVMIIMALDHTRDFFSGSHGDPLDIGHASTALFFTRWITHFCAPIFVFLSGTSAFLSMSSGKPKKETSLLLLKRGIWLIILELTLVRVGWTFNFEYHHLFVQVIWAIGWSMICLSALVYLPLPAIATIALIIIFGHNLLDGIPAAHFGPEAWLWDVLHIQTDIPYGNKNDFNVFYPIIPWPGVMAIGYCFGSFLKKPEHLRNKYLYSTGIAAIVLFIVLRFINVYGDPHPWQVYSTTTNTVLSFIKCEKYPPSLLYLLMTIGPAITLMPLLEHMNNSAGKFFTVYGRVPMFYYILHLYVLHGMAILAGFIVQSYFPATSLALKNTGLPLQYVYLFWAIAIALLYYPCRWFMHIKATHKKWWLSYL
jgi:uncharacterized membrane protein